MANINKNIIMQAGAAVANATNKAAGLSTTTPEPGSIISAIQLVNGGRTIGPDALAHFTESVRNKLLSLMVTMEPIQSGSGTPSPDNVRPISGRTGAHVYVSPTSDVADATTYSVDWTSQAGTVYGGTLDVVTGVLTVNRAMVDMGTLNWVYSASAAQFRASLPYAKDATSTEVPNMKCEIYKTVSYAEMENNDMCISRFFASTNGINVKDSRYTNAATFKTAMSDVQLCYELATPITYQLTGTDILTSVGDNYIWSDSGDVTITE